MSDDRVSVAAAPVLIQSCGGAQVDSSAALKRAAASSLAGEQPSVRALRSGAGNLFFSGSVLVAFALRGDDRLCVHEFRAK